MKISKLLTTKRKFGDQCSVTVKDVDCVLVITNCVAAFDYGLSTSEIEKLDSEYRLVAIATDNAHHQIGRYRSGGLAQDVTHIPEIVAMLDKEDA